MYSTQQTDDQKEVLCPTVNNLISYIFQIKDWVFFLDGNLKEKYKVLLSGWREAIFMLLALD